MELWTTPILRFHIRSDRASVELLPKRAGPQSIDERIEKIEAARLNLTEALTAIDELRQAAEDNKVDLAKALQALTDTEGKRADAAKQLEALREIAENDVGAFQRLAGVPSRGDIARERFIGFLFGIAASVIASGIWWAFTRLWPLLKS